MTEVDDRNLSPQNQNIVIGPFVLGRTLGEGTFGKVRLATHVITTEKVAVKILEKRKILEQSDKSRVEREINILKQLRHKNIIQIYQIIQTRANLYLIMEYAPGEELFKYICQKKRLCEVEACKYFQQILSGIEYFHKLGIVHRDLKPENLLLDHNSDIKIVDFGLSNIYQKDELLKTPCGSPCYAAPEMIDGKQYHGLMVDIWSCGIILYAMICGYLPFDDVDNDVLYSKITSGEFTIPEFVSDKAKHLIRKILVTNPEKRYNLDDIKIHPWFNSVNVNLNDGLFVNVHKIPIDETIIENMQLLGFEREQIKESVLNNRHDHLSTTYYLLVKKFTRKGISSVSDLVSDDFLEYIRNPNNLVSENSQDDEFGEKGNTESQIPIETLSSEREMINERLTMNVENFKSLVKKNKLKNESPLKKYQLIGPASRKNQEKQKNNIKVVKKPTEAKSEFKSRVIRRNKHDKTTTITINNINTNISINATINLTTDQNMDDLENKIGKGEFDAKKSLAHKLKKKIKDIHIPIPTRKVKVPVKERKYNYVNNFINTSTSYELNIDNKNQSVEPSLNRNNLSFEKRSNQNKIKNKILGVIGDLSRSITKAEYRTLDKSIAKESEFQIIKEEDEYCLKNKAFPNIKPLYQKRLDTKKGTLNRSQVRYNSLPKNLKSNMITMKSTKKNETNLKQLKVPDLKMVSHRIPKKNSLNQEIKSQSDKKNENILNTETSSLNHSAFQTEPCVSKNFPFSNEKGILLEISSPVKFERVKHLQNPFDTSCVFYKDIKFIRERIERALESLSMRVNYSLKSKNKYRFKNIYLDIEIELYCLDSDEQIIGIKFKKKEGTYNQYINKCCQIVEIINKT